MRINEALPTKFENIMSEALKKVPLKRSKIIF